MNDISSNQQPYVIIWQILVVVLVQSTYHEQHDVDIDVM